MVIDVMQSAETVVGLYVFSEYITQHSKKFSKIGPVVWRDLMTNRQIATSHFHISRHHLNRLLCTIKLKIMFGFLYYNLV